MFDLVEVVQEIVLSVILKIVRRSIDLPVISQAFSSLVEFNELLELKVGATESVFEPIDALSLDDEAHDHSTELHGHVDSIIFSQIHVDTRDESPEANVLKEINSFWVLLTALVEIDQCCWETGT